MYITYPWIETESLKANLEKKKFQFFGVEDEIKAGLKWLGLRRDEQNESGSNFTICFVWNFQSTTKFDVVSVRIKRHEFSFSRWFKIFPDTCSLSIQQRCFVVCLPRSAQTYSIVVSPLLEKSLPTMPVWKVFLFRKTYCFLYSSTEFGEIFYSAPSTDGVN